MALALVALPVALGSVWLENTCVAVNCLYLLLIDLVLFSDGTGEKLVSRLRLRSVNSWHN